MSTHYVQADTQWFADSGFGVAVHWTARSVPISGAALSFADAVNRFDVNRFLDPIAFAGAGYLLFTTVHALQQLPAPCAAIDRLLSGRTAARDLLGELADGCAARGMRLILYYNHSCNSCDDPRWEQAVGYHGPDKAAFARNICEIVAELSGRYGRRVAAWWFDSCYSLDSRGPANTVTCDMGDFQFPWEALTAAAKTGSAERLVSYNPGAWPPQWQYLYTRHQDYLAGEANELVEVPTSRWTHGGLQNHRWICLDNPDWVHGTADTPLWPARYRVDALAAYLRAARAAQTPVTFNVDVDQQGRMLAASLQMLQQANGQLC